VGGVEVRGWVGYGGSNHSKSNHRFCRCAVGWDGVGWQPEQEQKNYISADGLWDGVATTARARNTFCRCIVGCSGVAETYLHLTHLCASYDEEYHERKKERSWMKYLLNSIDNRFQGEITIPSLERFAMHIGCSAVAMQLGRDRSQRH
jgi:hypothetical protein